MANLQSAIDALLKPLLQLALAVAALLTQFEMWLRDELHRLGVPQPIQTATLLIVAVVLILAALRLFGGVIRFAIVLILLLIGIHILLPVLRS